jgi:tRNA G10  N-methylase Trm11
MIIDEQEFLLGRLAFDPGGDGSTQLVTASAHRVPLMDNSIDVVLTSPPYLTRIDYAVAYARELAVLGIDVLKSRELRSSLMGTTLIRSSRLEDLSLGAAASDLIRRVSAHPSKASRGYYLKQVRQYLDDLCISLDEITRVAKNGASLCMVVQDSFYKDEHVPLAEICKDEADRRGWIFDSLTAFPVIRSLTSLNKEARKYKKSQVEESVITFRKPKQ